MDQVTHSISLIQWWGGLQEAERAAWAAVLVGILSAAGGFAAAWASFRAAKVAVQLAYVPVRQQAEFKRAQAQVMAYAICSDLERAYSAALLAKQLFAVSTLRADIASVSDLAGTSQVNELSMITRFLDSLDCFGTEDGATISAAAASILSYNATMADVASPSDYEVMSKVDGAYHDTLADMCQFAAESMVDEVKKALDVLRKYGLKIYADNGVGKLLP